MKKQFCSDLMSASSRVPLLDHFNSIKIIQAQINRNRSIFAAWIAFSLLASVDFKMWSIVGLLLALKYHQKNIFCMTRLRRYQSEIPALRINCEAWLEYAKELIDEAEEFKLQTDGLEVIMPDKNKHWLALPDIKETFEILSEYFNYKPDIPSSFCPKPRWNTRYIRGV